MWLCVKRGRRGARNICARRGREGNAACRWNAADRWMSKIALATRKSNSPMRLMSKVRDCNALITGFAFAPFSIPEICRSFRRSGHNSLLSVSLPAVAAYAQRGLIPDIVRAYNLRYDIRSLRINNRKAFADAQ